MRILKRLRPEFYINLSALAVLSLVTAYCSDAAARGSFAPAGLPTFFVSFLVVMLLTAAAFIPRGGLKTAFAVVFIPVYMLSCICCFKNSVRGEPLYFSDIAYTFKVFGVTGSSVISVTAPMAFSFALGATAFSALFYVRLPKTGIRERAGQAAVLLGVILAVGLFGGLSSPYEPRDTLNGSFIAGYIAYSPLVDGIARLPAQAEGGGMSASSREYGSRYFKVNFDLYGEDYLAAWTERLRQSVPEVEYSGVKPNVIVYLSESFWDILTLPNLELSGDPIENFRRLREQSVWGELISMTFGGGTADVEFEVLTGLLSRYLNTTLSAYEAIGNRPVYSAATVFGRMGYNSLGIHTYKNYFYNRGIVYPNLGFDEFWGDSQMSGAPLSGYYISDDYLVDRIIEGLEASESPLFLSAVSMENHQPYDKGKYPSCEITVNDPGMPAALAETVAAYAEGLLRADRALKRLTDYLSESDEPTVLLFYGDHQPTLGADFELYRYTGSISAKNPPIDEIYSLLKTPFMIWSNYIDKSGYIGEAGSNYIMSLLFDYIGMEKPLFFRLLDEMYQINHFMGRSNLFVGADGTLTGSIPENLVEYDDVYGLVMYDMILGRGYVKDELWGFGTE